MQGVNPTSAGSPARESAPAAPRESAPAPAPGWVVERPPPGLARGRMQASPWLVGALGVAAVLLAAAFYLRVLRARRRKSPS